MPKSKQNKNHKQNIYRMRGCSKNTKKSYFGGTKLAGDFTNLAYPYNGPITPNPFLAVTNIKGGYKCPEGTTPQTPPNLGIVTTSNVNGANPLYPNTGPPFNGFNFLNPITNQRGGNCNCGISAPSMTGGARRKKMHMHKNGCSCSECKHKHHSITCSCASCKHKKHRDGCRCSLCKMKHGNDMSGGGGCSTSNNGIPYPNGLVGKPFENPTNLPGANHIPGDANFYKLNTYNNDVSRQMVDVGANRPFLGFFGLGGGGKSRKSHKKMAITKKRKQRGGTLSNFLGQDLINLGRQIGFGMGSAYNALNGYSAPTNPLPWKDQLPNTVNLHTIKNL